MIPGALPVLRSLGSDVLQCLWQVARSVRCGRSDVRPLSESVEHVIHFDVVERYATDFPFLVGSVSNNEFIAMKIAVFVVPLVRVVL